MSQDKEFKGKGTNMHNFACKFYFREMAMLEATQSLQSHNLQHNVLLELSLGWIEYEFENA